MRKFELQDPNKFIKDFIKEVAKAKKRVWIQTMYFEVGNKTKIFEEALIKAVKKGIDVRVVIDWSTRRHIKEKIHLMPILPIRSKNREELKVLTRRSEKILEKLEEAGIKVILANQPGVNGHIVPFLKRSHAKIFIVDNLFWTGGINLTDAAFDNIDFMIKFKHQKLIDSISKQFPQLSKKETKNYLFDVDDNYRLLIDNGRYNKSIIYNHAVKMVERAKKEIVFVSQYVPDGILLKKLVQKAKERVNVIIITSHREHKVFTKFPYTPLYKRLRSKIKYNPYIKLVHCSKKVHAKLLEVDKKEVIFGSHNFVKTTVWVGTQEISIHSKDEKLIRILDEFAKNLYKDYEIK